MTAIPRAHLVATIDTPHPVYGLHWSADGERLALSGGYLYGRGFVGLADPSGRLVTLRDHDSLAAEPLVDGADLILPAVCLDDRGEWLAAAACSYKWHARGPLLFRVVDDRLVLVDAPELDEPDDARPLSGHATGVWLHRGRLFVRYRAPSLGEALRSWPTPTPTPIHADEARAHLTNSRITVVDDVVWIAKNLTRIYSSAGTGPPMSPGSDAFLIENPHGLAALDLRDPGAALRLTATDVEARCTALVRDRAGARLFAGLDDHRIVEWRVDARGEIAQGRAWTHPPGPREGAVIVRGIQGLCGLADGETLVSAAHGGGVALWRDGAAIGGFELPPPWSPRTIAAHPRAPWLAIGCKGASGHRPGAVLLYDVGAIVSRG
ncbi:MAG: hypothetical protein R3B09_18850 [Nannocystaceae bacterium]